MADTVFSVNTIRANLPLGGARPTLFQVQITNPANASAALQYPFRVMSTILPSSDIGTIQLPYFGRPYKLAGDRVFQSWPVGIVEDEDWNVRQALEDWSNKINGLEDNTRDFSDSATSDYKATAIITQFSKTAQPLRVYTMQGIWPSSISQINMNWGDTNNLVQYNCVFEYDFFDYEDVAGTPGA